ncbi:MAG: PQQ-binding-like beta-propeller repeat protein, partial [Planctomycetota bacterium]
MPVVLRYRLFVACCLCMLAALTDIAPAANPASTQWSQFRGNGGAGVAASDQVFLRPGDDGKLVWRAESTGIGWSSPVLHENRLWMTSAETVPVSEAVKKERLAGDPMGGMKTVVGSVVLRAVCIDADNGDVLVDKELTTIQSPNPIHPMNGFASPTAAIAGDRVVLHFGQYGTFCLNADSGDVLWKQRIVFSDSVGPGSSPMIDGDVVVITCDGTNEQFVTGLSMTDGSEKWRTKRPAIDAGNPEFQKAYCTPLIATIGGRRQAIITGAQWCCSYDPQTGDEWWRFDFGPGFSVATMPILAGDAIVISTGYMAGDLVAIDPTGSGDVTKTHQRWRQSRGGPKKPSLSYADGRVFCISD